MDVSIIIVNYNTISCLLDAIDSVLLRAKDIKYEIIVADNNSTDNSKSILFERYGNRIIYLDLPENIGFGRANNEAVKIAKGRNLFFLNPDTILLNNAVKILSDYLDDNADVGACGGNLFDENMLPAVSFAAMLPSLSQTIDELLGYPITLMKFGKNRYFNFTNTAIKVAGVIGADLMIKKELFNILGGFDRDFFMYYEELELCFRINKVGFQMYNIPCSHIQHLEGKSISNDYKKIRSKYYARMLYLSKTQTKVKLLLINHIYRLSSIMRLMVFSVLRNREKRLFGLRYLN